jgi:hypothetical protein
MQYLTFDCFDSALTDNEVRGLLTKAATAASTTASLHWNHHLEAAVPYMKPDDLSNSTNFGTSINDFFEMYHPGQQLFDSQKEYSQKCKTIEGGDCFESVVRLLSHAKASRLSREELDALGTLGSIVTRVRANLEERALASLGQVPSPDSKLTDFYGDHWYKCSCHAGYYFHEGFRDDNLYYSIRTGTKNPSVARK